MDHTAENHRKYTQMSKKDLVTEIVGICMHIIMSKNMLDDWLNKKQILIDLHRTLRNDYTNKYENKELELIIFNEGRIICDIEYTLDKKIDNKIHIANEGDDDRDEEALDGDEEVEDSDEEAVGKISLTMLIPVIKSLSKLKKNSIKY